MSYLTHQELGVDLNDPHVQHPPHHLHTHQQEGEEGAAAEGGEGEEDKYPESLLPRLSLLNCQCTATTSPSSNHQPPLKRRLPFSSSSSPASKPQMGITGAPTFKERRALLPDERMAKKPFRADQDDIHFTLRGFSKISLPSNLGQTSSDPHGTTNGSDSGLGRRVNNSVCGAPRGGVVLGDAVPLSPEKVGFGANPAATPSPVKWSSPSVVSVLPPLPPLRRTVSDPTPSPGGSNSFFMGSSSSGQSPNSRRLRRMKRRLKEMGRWWDHVIREAEEDEGGTNEPGIIRTTKEKECAATDDDETQEAVSVEVLGDCLSINFNCPCGKGYQILLSGKNCYYKLV